jgi:hypothetical protein
MGKEKQGNALQVLPDDRFIDRDIIDLNTIITQRANNQLQARLVDMSPFGFHGRGAHKLSKGEVIRVILPLVGDVKARVAWTLIDCFGGLFIHPIDERIYPRLLATIKTGRQEWLI